MKNIRFELQRTITFALFLAVASVATVWAQNPPAGAIFDLATTNQHTGVLSGYQHFTTTFTADSSATYVSFAFREVPAFFAIDDTSVKDTQGGGELLQDPGFESATVGQLQPYQWQRWIQPIDVSAIGMVASAGAPYGCPPNGPYGGTKFYCDGSVQGYDALYQLLTTQANHTYQVSFWLGDNSGDVPSNPGIDMLVYAGDHLPDGTESVTPEPGSLLLLGSGVLGLGGLLRRRLLG